VKKFSYRETREMQVKFEDSKIFRADWDQMNMIFSYAGDPDAARVMFRNICRQLWQEILKGACRELSQAEAARSALETIFRDRDSKGLQTLIGLKFHPFNYYLFKTSNKKVVEGFTEYIGGGDGSALRYLCDFLCGEFLPSMKRQFSVRTLFRLQPAI
jgi:hypothetical protein